MGQFPNTRNHYNTHTILNVFIVRQNFSHDTTHTVYTTPYACTRIHGQIFPCTIILQRTISISTIKSPNMNQRGQQSNIVIRDAHTQI